MGEPGADHQNTNAALRQNVTYRQYRTVSRRQERRVGLVRVLLAFWPWWQGVRRRAEHERQIVAGRLAVLWREILR